MKDMLLRSGCAIAFATLVGTSLGARHAAAESAGGAMVQDSIPSPTAGDCPSSALRCVVGWFTDPATPVDATPTRLVLWGGYPYFCGHVADARVLDSGHVSLVLDRGWGCSDTLRTWSQDFSLGTLAAGSHDVQVDLEIRNDPYDDVLVHHGAIPISVLARTVWVIPNPFTDVTNLIVANVARGPVDIGVFDLHGRRVATLFHGTMEPGLHEVTWSMVLDNDRPQAIGVYFARVVTASHVETRTLVRVPRR